jgi:plasmid maintenance system antidote protein VapI
MVIGMATRKKNSKTAAIAAPVREYLRHAIKQKIKTNKDREALAKFLGQSPTSISNLLKGEGGLDTWVAALAFCYDLKPETMLEMMENYHVLLHKLNPTESDRIAARIVLPERKRAKLFNAILTGLMVTDDEE